MEFIKLQDIDEIVVKSANEVLGYITYHKGVGWLFRAYSETMEFSATELLEISDYMNELC